MKKYILLVFVIASSSAHATCWYAGYDYPTGAVVNGLTCQANGSWR